MNPYVVLQGEHFEVTTVPNKPTPTGIKIWNIGQRGSFHGGFGISLVVNLALWE
jgi:hypothetical protein